MHTEGRVLLDLRWWGLGLAHRKWIAAVVLGIAVTLLAAESAIAAVHDLRTILLRPSDAPAGLSHPVYKLFTHPPQPYGYDMTLTVQVSGGAKAHLTCHAGSGWTQGLIDFFAPSSPGVEMGLCAGLFKTATAAHQQYHIYTASFGTAIKAGYMRLLTKAQIGDESVAFSPRPSRPQSGRTSYTLIFRRSNALVYLVYTGPSGYSASSFVRLGHATSSRLH